MYLPQGTELNNRYVIESLLGHGGFGITYAAYDKVLNVRVAVKEYLPRQLATRGEGQTRVSVFTGEARQQYDYGLRKFLEEAQSMARFAHHPNVVSARDYFEANGTAYMVMEYVEGVTLKEYLANKGGRISFEEAKGIMMPVMDALREVHHAGMLHRDISPDNIYITTSAQVKILDFGAARYFAGEQSKSLSVILKSGYAPEEQYRSSGKQGPWTDVYAVGATFYKLLTGQKPPDALDRMAGDTLEPPSRLGVKIPPPAERALLQSLAVNAGQRFQTMGEFQQALLGAAPRPGQVRPAHAPLQQAPPEPAYTPASAPAPGPVSPQSEGPPPHYLRPPRSSANPAAIAAGIVVGVIGLILVVILTMKVILSPTMKEYLANPWFNSKQEEQHKGEAERQLQAEATRKEQRLKEERERQEKVNNQLTMDDIKNMEYRFDYQSQIKLINGECNHKGINSNVLYKLDTVVFGDLNNDSIKDAIVVLNEHDGNAVNIYLCAVINKDGKPSNVSCIDIGGRGSIVKSVNIKSGKIIINKLVVGPHDSNVSPTLRETLIYRVMGDRLVADQPIASFPKVNPISAATSKDNLHLEAEKLAEKIRAAHLNKDINKWLACYHPAYLNLGRLENQILELWKNYDVKEVSYRISNMQRQNDRQAVADIVWNIQVWDQRTHDYTLLRPSYRITLEKGGSIWKIRDCKEEGR